MRFEIYMDLMKFNLVAPYLGLINSEFACQIRAERTSNKGYGLQTKVLLPISF